MHIGVMCQYDILPVKIYIVIDIPVRLIFLGANVCVYWIIESEALKCHYNNFFY